MNRTYFTIASLFTIVSAVVGCGGAHGDDALHAPGASHRDGPSAEAPSAPLYFEVTNRLSVDGDKLAAVDLVAGAKVQLEAVTTDGTPIRFELWRAHADGQTELVNAFDVESGFVLTTFEAPSDGRTLLHFPAPVASRDVVVHLGCVRENGRCTDAMQPGETCFAGHSCAVGLACVPSDGTCDADWKGGTCALPGYLAICDTEPALGQVCGCDGRTYDSACLARANGVGIQQEGACVPTAPPTPPA